MSDLVIEQGETADGGAWFIEQDGRRVGEMVYDNVDARTIKILHTEVGKELRGRGAGLKLVETGVAWARAHGKKIIPQCPYARKTISEHPELQDVLAPAHAH